MLGVGKGALASPAPPPIIHFRTSKKFKFSGGSTPPPNPPKMFTHTGSYSPTLKLALRSLNVSRYFKVNVIFLLSVERF